MAVQYFYPVGQILAQVDGCHHGKPIHSSNWVGLIWLKDISAVECRVNLALFFAGLANNPFKDLGAEMRQITVLATEEDCEKQWIEARAICRSLIHEQMQQRAGREKQRRVNGVTGSYTDVEECARGLVSEECGGNKKVE